MSVCAMLLAATAAITGPTDNPEDQFRGMWYLCEGDAAAKTFSEFGFNFVYFCRWGFDVKNECLKPDSTARRDRWIALGEKYGFDVAETHGTLPYDPLLRKNFPQVRADGSKNSYTDMADPEVKRIVHKLTALNAATVPKDRPRFIGFSPASEVRDPSFPVSAKHFDDAWAAYSGGKPMPDHRNSKTSVHYAKLKDFPASRVIPDDRNDFVFFKWFWKHGDGWNDYFSDEVREFDRAAGKRLMSFHDPAVRNPPIWGIGGDVAYLNQWTYIYPEPFNISFVTACLEAMARGKPGQRIIQMAQAISYRSALAPIGMKPADGPEPDWVAHEPTAVYITTPPDLMQEAIWTLYSHQVDGILFHGWDSIVDATKYTSRKSGYRYTCDGLQATISNLFTGVGRELGPLFKALPESGRKVALLERSPAWIYAKRGEGGYANGKYSSAALMATLGGLMPYVLYDEEIARDGIPAETEVLLMPFCDVLTETTAKAVKAFQKRGGVVLADENLAPDVLPDGELPSFDRSKRAAVDEPALRKAAQRLKADVKRVTTLDAETDSPDILVRLRRMKSADYLFAINDRRGPGAYVGAWGLVWEKGLPNRGRVSVRRAAGAVYDLAQHVAVPFEVKDGRTFVDVAYATNDGRCLLVADKPLSPLTVSVDGGRVTVRTPDAGLMVPIRVDRAGAKPFFGVVRDGVWSYDFGAASDVRVTNLADGAVVGK